VDAGTPPSTWGLTDVGRLDAVQLVDHLPQVSIVAIACGGEPKMIETVTPLAQRLGISVTVDAAFAETHGDGWFEIDEFHALVARLFAEPGQPPAAGWECGGDAAARFLAGLRRLHVGDGAVVVCSGGRMLTSVLVALGVFRGDEAFGVWSHLRMPDVAVLSMPADGPALLVTAFGTTGLTSGR